MNFSTYRFTLDLQKHQSQISIAAFQYDTAIKLSIGLTDGGVPYYLEDGCIAVLYGKKANGEPIVHTCSIEANTRIVYEFNKETANELGIVDCQICFYKDGKQILSAPKFIIVVAKRAVNDVDVYDNGEDNFSEQFSALDNMFVSEAERVSAEDGRVEAENARALAEEKRQELYDMLYKFTKGLAYELSEDETYYIVSGKGTATDTEIVIPPKYNGLPVISIAQNAFAHDDNITSIIIPDSVTETGDNAFNGCNNLTIYCEAESKPEGWSSAWNSSNRPVVWGVSLDFQGVNDKIDRKFAEATEAIEDNNNALKEVNKTLGNKADSVHYHAISDVAALQETLDSKVDKISLGSRLYGTDASGKGAGYKVDTQDTASSIPWRTVDGDLIVPETPSVGKGAASRNYVQKFVNAANKDISERLSNLESLTLSYIEDSEVAYEKTVPEGVAEYALIKSVGGASVKSKNILNPRDITIVTATETVIEPIINEDNSISFTLNYTDGLSAFVRINPLNKARYYYFIEGDTPDHTDVREYLELEYKLPEGEEYGEQYYPDNWDWTVKIMLWEAEDSDTFSYDPAPNGTVFEPYFAGFKHAKVERIESLGKNHAQKQYGISSSGAAVDSTLLKKDTSNKHCYSMIPIRSGTKYTISKSGSTNGGSSFRYFYFDREPILNETMSIGGAYLGGQAKSTFTAPDNAKYLYVRWTEDDITYPCGDVQIELGDTATEYKPYKSDSLVIPDTVRNREGFGNGIDATDYNYLQIVDGKAEYVQVCDEIVLTGNETMYTYLYVTTQGNGIRFPNILTEDSNRLKGICTDCDKVGSYSGTNNIMWLGLNDSYNSRAIFWLGILDELGFTTVDEFKTYLANRYASGNPVRIIYKRNEPIVTDITGDFAEDNFIKVEGGGTIRFSNDNGLAVPNTIQYIIRKE